MMQHLANDVSFWLALGAVFGLIKVWANSKSAEISARNSKDTVRVVAKGQDIQQATLMQLTAAVAALQAITPAPTAASSSSPSVPAGGGQPGTLAPTPVVQGVPVAADAPAIVLPSSELS